MPTLVEKAKESAEFEPGAAYFLAVYTMCKVIVLLSELPDVGTLHALTAVDALDAIKKLKAFLITPG